MVYTTNIRCVNRYLIVRYILYYCNHRLGIAGCRCWYMETGKKVKEVKIVGKMHRDRRREFMIEGNLQIVSMVVFNFAYVDSMYIGYVRNKVKSNYSIFLSLKYKFE
jgi:hypothetical protein